MRVAYVIVVVSDMSRSVSFYRHVLGLPPEFESPDWSEFATEGATLALHAGDGKGADDGNRRPLTPGRCRPGLRVPDLDASHARMVGEGVACIREPEEAFGVRIAQYADPDGLEISVSEERRAG